MATERPAEPHWLVRDAASGRLVLQKQPSGIRQSPLVDDLLLDEGGVRIAIERDGSRRAVSGTVLPALDPRDTVTVETSRGSLLIAPVERPMGAASRGGDRDGIFIQSPPFGRWERRWRGDALRTLQHPDGQGRWALEADGVVRSESGGALAFGIDARFGICAELTVATEHGRASQRLRWIPPGTFPMGSPEDEPGRYASEGPRHEVTLSEGFWLFDTPCTQSLWQAVIGHNPSRFKSPDRPVEQVS